MQEIVGTLRQFLDVIQVIVVQAFDFSVALVDLVWTSSVSLTAPAFLGVTVGALLAGLLLGRFSKRGDPGIVKIPRATWDDRVVLDLEKLRPLGLSAEEEVEAEVMDISGLQKEESVEGTSRGLIDRQQRSETAPQR